MTHDTLMALAAAYATEQLHAHYHPAMEARAALSTALQEVLAERDQLDHLRRILETEWQDRFDAMKAQRDALAEHLREMTEGRDHYMEKSKAFKEERDALQNNLANATNILQSVLNGNTSAFFAQTAVNAFNEFLDDMKGTP